MRKKLTSSKSLGDCATPPTKRRKWHGAVRYMLCARSRMLLPQHCSCCVQMKSKIQKLTEVFLEAGGGNADATAQLFANFTSQRVIQPFVAREMETPQQRFGENALATLEEIKKTTRKAGCAADMIRRHILVAGSAGPLSPHPV